VTVTYSTTNPSCQANGLFSAAYVDDFDRAHVAAHYLGDVGSAPTNATPKTYSVEVPGGKDFTVSWNMSVAGWIFCRWPGSPRWTIAASRSPATARMTGA
jgi:hypothetical protein